MIVINLKNVGRVVRDFDQSVADLAISVKCWVNDLALQTAKTKNYDTTEYR